MAAKDVSTAAPVEVFREFAWHLAGSLAKTRQMRANPPRRPRPAGPSGKR
jgi:hypothetical protein